MNRGGEQGWPQLLMLLAEKLPIGTGITELKQVETTVKRTLKDALYKQIFAQIWSRLSEDARSLLDFMRLAPSVGIHDELLNVYTGMTKRRRWAVVKQLHQVALLEKRWRHGVICHYIHNLTDNYLWTIDQTATLCSVRRRPMIGS